MTGFYEDSGVGGSVNPHTLDFHEDVNFTAVVDGDNIKWDSQTSRWINYMPSSANINLNDIGDVTSPTPADGEVLTWSDSSGAWVNGAVGGGGATNLPELLDVTISGAVSGEVLTYNGSIWINQASSSGDLDGLSDVIITTPSNGDRLEWSGSTWINVPAGAATGNPITVGDGSDTSDAGLILDAGSLSGDTAYLQFQENSVEALTIQANAASMTIGNGVAPTPWETGWGVIDFGTTCSIMNNATQGSGYFGNNCYYDGLGWKSKGGGQSAALLTIGGQFAGLILKIDETPGAVGEEITWVKTLEFTESLGSIYEQVYFTEDTGRVGVGTDSPIAPIHVLRTDGNVMGVFESTSPSAGITMKDSLTTGNTTVGVYANANALELRAGSGNRWQVSSAGAFLALVNNVYNIGDTAGFRPKNIYAGTSMVAPSGVFSDVFAQSGSSLNSHFQAVVGSNSFDTYLRALEARVTALEP
jgi:hypothetical protein